MLLFFRFRRTLWQMAVASLAIFCAGCGQIVTRPTSVAVIPTLTTTPTAALPPRPTATPAPYTPEPTATPTVTPTPIIHTIARGETLSAIASRYGVTIGAIQELNGIADPRRLQVGQQLFIPASEEQAPAGSTPTPASTPLSADIGPIHFGNSPTGGLWALGEVTNPITVPLEGVRIGVSLLDASGAITATAEALAQTDVITPGGSSPFGVYFPHPPATFANYLLQILSAYPAHLGIYYLDLQAVAVQHEGERYQAHRVRGRVRNIGPEVAVEVQLTITLYDATDKVIGFVRAEPEHNVIPRGGETTFDAQVIPLGGPVARAVVIAQGRRLPPGAAANDSTTPTPAP